MNDYLEKYININKNKEIIIKNDDYMNWVDSVITSKGMLFSDSDSKDLEYLYYAIDDYAKNNYIYDYYDGCNGNYCIKFKDKFYTIGVVAGQGIYYYIKLVNDCLNNYLCFNDIISNKRQEKAKDIDNKFSKIKFLIDSLKGMNVSIDLIENEINDYLYQIRSKDIKIKKLKYDVNPI